MLNILKAILLTNLKILIKEKLGFEFLEEPQFTDEDNLEAIIETWTDYQKFKPDRIEKILRIKWIRNYE
jgi:hypothetical protein